MLRRFLSRIESCLRARGRAGRHSGHSRPARSTDLSPIRQEGARSAHSLECPLCDKRCILAAPRCKHGEAFVQFMRAHGGDPRQSRIL
jgi:hypothetical protein